MAGIDLDTLNIAPIIKYMKHWSLNQIEDYCNKKDWKVMSLITVQDVRIEEVKKGRTSYEKATLVFTDEKGEQRTKYIVSWSNPQVFATAKKAVSGQKYEMTQEKQGEYWNITALSQVVSDADQPQAGSITTKTGSVPARSNYETSEERAQRQLMIVRQSSISNAIALLSPTGSKAVPQVEDVLKVAQRFVDFVYDNDQEDLAALPTD